MSRNIICSECDGTMQKGSILNLVGLGYYPDGVPYWTEGIPERNFLGGVKVRKTKRYTVSAFRCEKCGFVKLYTDLENNTTK